MNEGNQQLTDEQKREAFKKLPPDFQWMAIKPQVDIITSAISKKMSVLPSLSALAATLMVIATLRPDLIPISIPEVKIILSLLLLIIPVSLLVYIRDQEAAVKRAGEIIEGYTGKDPFRNIKPTLGDKFVGWLPMSITIIYFAIVFFLLYTIWCR